MQQPYLMFLGDVQDQLAAKTCDGIVHWRPDWCIGQFRLPDCKADVRLSDLTLAEGLERGAKTLVIGVANPGGRLPRHWTDSIVDALQRGYDVASGLHDKLSAIPQIAAAAKNIIGSCLTFAIHQANSQQVLALSVRENAVWQWAPIALLGKCTLLSPWKKRCCPVA